MLRTLLLPGVILASLAAGGCQQHYRVTDPQTGRVYYTECITRHVGGAVTFKDGRTHDHITLQNSEVNKITEETFDEGLRTAAPAATPK